VSGEMTQQHINFLHAIGRKYHSVADQPGMVSARVISMIINEAYFAMEDGISSENEIDIAMKLGTNYPKGPFEWKSQIGVESIYKLLDRLSNSDLKYTPSKLLKAEAEKI
jgi:3-hydroxybutyryl-CoA dehydrogenase